MENALTFKPLDQHRPWSVAPGYRRPAPSAVAAAPDSIGNIT
jgi:hypothetical protein